MRRAVNIALTGYRATGKSRVAEELSRRLGCEQLDTDQQVQRRAGRTIREIFAESGEAEFRDLEAAAVADCLRRPRVVIALGGGAVLRQPTRRLLRERSAVVWLRAAPEEIWRRLQADSATAPQRPALTNLSGFDEIAAVLADREPLYRDVADIQIETDGKPLQKIAEEIVSLLGDCGQLPDIQAWVGESRRP